MKRKLKINKRSRHAEDIKTGKKLVHIHWSNGLGMLIKKVMVADRLYMYMYDEDLGVINYSPQ